MRFVGLAFERGNLRRQFLINCQTNWIINYSSPSVADIQNFDFEIWGFSNFNIFSFPIEKTEYSRLGYSQRSFSNVSSLFSGSGGFFDRSVNILHFSQLGTENISLAKQPYRGGTSSQESKNEKNEIRLVVAITLWAIFVGIGIFGMWHFMFMSQNVGSGAFGLLLIVIGFIGTVASGTWAFSIYDLASLNRRSENVVVKPIVVSELELGNRHKG